MYDFNDFDALLADLESLDPVATAAAALDLGPSARVSREYLNGRPVDGGPADDGWIDADPHPALLAELADLGTDTDEPHEPGAPLDQQEGDDA
ncbi:hypothetical protein C6369_021300 [Rhodococcus rhodochrous]|uniref:hypothetical protein n=1 Tax=Rhodococcus rhodochrous TaxID=1829 RepID=UPI000D07D4A2|nr:hypothetical protein [Rhodococcus rhodochrous]AYA26724.1 hypothetical protein C6369_021300 [Rhodococcus rhodochrous]